MLAIDLLQDWINSTVTIRSIIKPSGVPTFSSGSLWYHESEGLLYSGFSGQPSNFASNPSLPAQSIWTFKPDGTGSGVWSKAIDANAPTLKSVSQPVGALMAYGPESAWALGGCAATGDPYSRGRPQPGMVNFNFGSKTFTNESAIGYTSNGTVADGAMQYVPSFGPEGLLVVMGGTPPIVDEQINFATVHVYDPAKQEWFNQTTTGDAPAARAQFCAAGVNSTNGTYEMLGPFSHVLNGGLLTCPPVSCMADELVASEQKPSNMTRSTSSPFRPSIGSASHTTPSIPGICLLATPSEEARSS